MSESTARFNTLFCGTVGKRFRYQLPLGKNLSDDGYLDRKENQPVVGYLSASLPKFAYRRNQSGNFNL